MALQFRRGTAADVASESFVPAIGEPVYLTDEQKLYVGDGATQGGVAVSGPADLKDLTSVRLISESVGAINTYEVASNVATVSLSLSHDYYIGLQVVIASSPVTILNGTHTITDLPTSSQFRFALTTADVASTSTTGSVTPKVADGSALVWNETQTRWEDHELGLNDLSDVDLTTPATTGQVLSYDGTNFVAGTVASDLVNDTTPQLGGSLDVNGNDIVSASNGDIGVAPDGTGKLTIKGNATGGSGQIALNCEQNTHAVIIQGPAHAAAANYTLTLPDDTGTVGQTLTTNGSGTLSWADAAPSALHTSFYFVNASAPTGTIANSNLVGQNYGTWTEVAFGGGVGGPSSAAFDPTLIGIVFDPVNGQFSGIPQGRYHITFNSTVVIDNVTPAFGTTCIHILSALNAASSFSYISEAVQFTPLPYASYGSAAHRINVAMDTFAVFEESTPANNLIQIYGDQDVKPSYYFESAMLNIIKVADI